MAKTTKIAWTDSTFNPWLGCTRVSPGCDHCYAEAMDSRKLWNGRTHWGVRVPRMRTSAACWQQPLLWNKKATRDGRRHLVFCGSMCDVFDNEVPLDWRDDLFALIRATPALTWLLLTKRISNAARMVPPYVVKLGAPLTMTRWPNIWLGVSVVNQEEADRDILHLLDISFPVKRFVSYEPALESVDWRPWLAPTFRDADGPKKCLDWLIIGGESGRDARPFDLAWARSTIEQCRAANVSAFMKQLGSRPIGWNIPKFVVPPRSRYAWDEPEWWPADLRVQQFPEGD